MNTYNKHGTHIIDARDNPWNVNIWHPMPVPEGIDTSDAIKNRFEIVLGPLDSRTGFTPFNPTHWLARAPMPPCPEVKTQAQKDAEAFKLAMSILNVHVTPETFNKFGQLRDGAIAYARAKP